MRQPAKYLLTLARTDSFHQRCPVANPPRRRNATKRLCASSGLSRAPRAMVAMGSSYFSRPGASPRPVASAARRTGPLPAWAHKTHSQSNGKQHAANGHPHANGGGSSASATVGLGAGLQNLGNTCFMNSVMPRLANPNPDPAVRT